MTDHDLLRDLLDTLLPGDDAHWPAAGQHGLAQRTREMAARMPGAADALAAVLAALPGTFAQATRESREHMLKSIEESDPEAFDHTVTAAYNAYYTDPAIRDLIEQLTGYENRPPQPLGYTLPDFDESLLDQVKARGSTWRPVPEE